MEVTHDLTLTGREATVALRELATAIAAGEAAVVLQAPPPAFIGTAFPDIAAIDRDRIALLLVWAMQIQHTETATELERGRRRRAAETFAQGVGFGDDRWQPFISFIHSIR